MIKPAHIFWILALLIVGIAGSMMITHSQQSKRRVSEDERAQTISESMRRACDAEFESGVIFGHLAIQSGAFTNINDVIVLAHKLRAQALVAAAAHRDAVARARLQTNNATP